MGWLGPVRAVAWGALVAGAGFALVVGSASLPFAVGWAVAGCFLVGVGLANVVPVVFSLSARAGGTGGVAAVAMAGYGAVMVAPPLIGFISESLGLRLALCLLVLGSGAMAALARGVR